MLLCSAQTIPRKVKMLSNTNRKGVVFDVGSLYAHLQVLKDVASQGAYDIHWSPLFIKAVVKSIPLSY